MIFILAQIIISTVGLLIVFSKFKLKIHKRRALEHIESLITGGIKEKLIHRELEDYEREILRNKFKRTRNKNFDLDARSPVFRIQGQLISMRASGSKIVSIKEHWSVRGIVLNEDNFPLINHNFFKDGEEIAIEFSPFSKFVWDAYKIFKGKRVWLMGLSEDFFKLLKEGKVNVIARVPLGSHDFKDLRIFEYIAFFNAKFSILGNGPNVLTKVGSIHHYENLENLIDSEGLQNVFPQSQSKDLAVGYFLSLANFKERIQRGGVYAIHVERVKES